MKYSWNISDFVDDKNHQIVKNFASVLFNTQVKALNQGGYIFTLRTAMLDSLLQHNKALKMVAGEENLITVLFL